MTESQVGDRGAYVVLNRANVEDAVLRGYVIPCDTELLISIDDAAKECQEMNQPQPGKFQVYWLIPVAV